MCTPTTVFDDLQLWRDLDSVRPFHGNEVQHTDYRPLSLRCLSLELHQAHQACSDKVEESVLPAHTELQKR